MHEIHAKLDRVHTRLEQQNAVLWAFCHLISKELNMSEAFKNLVAALQPAEEVALEAVKLISAHASAAAAAGDTVAEADIVAATARVTNLTGVLRSAIAANPLSVPPLEPVAAAAPVTEASAQTF